ncbi:MAG TPA: hypothetical protein VIK29_03945 [Paludibacter sp.]|jgi:hypothetical protein
MDKKKEIVNAISLKNIIPTFFNLKTLQIYEKKQTFWGIVLLFSEKNSKNNA